MRIMILVFMLLSVTLLSGCFDKKELEQQGYVVAIGLDVSERKNMYNVTFQIANPEVGSTITGSASNEKPQETVTILANDILTARNAANAFVTRQISVDQTQVLIVSEELARSDDFIRLIQTFSRSTELRRRVQIVVSKEKASDFLKRNHPTLETRPHKYYQLMLNRAKDTGIIPDADVHRFFQITEGDADLFLAGYATTEMSKEKDMRSYEDEFVAGNIPKEGGDQTEFIGAAVFKEGKMIDLIDGQETRLCQILDHTTSIHDILATYPDPEAEGFRVATRFIKKQRNRVEISYHKNAPTSIRVVVPFEIEVIAIPSLVNYSENEKYKEVLKKSIEEDLDKKSMELVKKTQEKYSSDPFYWSLYIRKYFTSIKGYEAGDWNHKIYPSAKVSVEFKLKKIRFGKMVKSSNLSEVRD